MLNIFWVICDTWNLLIKFHKFVATNHVCGSKKFNFRSGLIMILKKCRKLICRHTRRWLNLQISTSSSWKKMIEYREGRGRYMRLNCSEKNFNKVIKVVITWSHLAGTKFCPVFPGSRQCYKSFIYYILQLHVKSIIPASWDPSVVLPGSRFARTKLSYVIASARRSGMTKLTYQFEKINKSTYQ